MSCNSVDSNGNLIRIAGGTLYSDLPVGSIIPYGGGTVSSGFLLCDGTAYSRTTYADLFAVIGTAFGSGDGSTTFNVPDLREATTKGVGTTTRTVGGHNAIELGAFVDDRVQSHTHPMGHTHTYSGTTSGASKTVSVATIQNNQAPQVLSLSGWNTNTATASSTTAHTHTYSGTTSDASSTNTGYNTGRYGSTTEVKAVGVNYIIKAKQTAVPFDVAEYIRNQNVLSDIETISLFDTSVTMPYDGIINGIRTQSGQCTITVNGTTVAISSQGTGGYGNSFSIPFNKGDVIATPNTVDVATVRYYKLRDYTGR